jgi:predicted O-linked N-acetylglucosamine transferase (SPINDLY family)
LGPLIALFNTGRYAELESRARALLGLHPNSGAVWKLFGLSLRMQGKDALHAFQKTVELMPNDAEAHNNLGNVLKDLGQLDSAVASYRRALEIKPDFAEAHSNLGAVVKGVGQYESSLEICRRAVALNPGSAEAHFNVGIALQDLGQLDDAVASYRRALEIKPNSAEAHFNVGLALQGIGQLNDAVASYRRALEIKPNLADAHNNLGNVLRELGNLEEAEACYRRALEIKPNFTEAYSNMLYMHAFTRNISPEQEYNLATNWENIALSESDRIAARNRSFDYPPRAGRKLRVGVVSAEIGQHAVAEFLEPLLEQMDRSRFHVTLFPTAIRTESRVARFRVLADEFIPLVGIPDNKAADLIRADRIDILIDTTAHMGGCRLDIFAHRAAPVQCHYIGYHGSTGLTEMDWFIADQVLLPSFCDAHFREGIWRLPRLWISYKGDASLPDSRWEPSPDGTVWLGSFNNLTKVREETLALWAKVMNAIPESRLFLKDRQSANSSVQERIRTELGHHGISGERVEFAGHVPDWRSHMALYDKLDIALDTIPLNSGTTAFDALWMGVPLIALEGSWMGARMTNAILDALGKPEWVAQNEDEYVAIVAALAKNVEERKSLRAAQRAQMASSPLCDAKGLTRALEDAFEAMFELWVGKLDQD